MIKLEEQDLKILFHIGQMLDMDSVERSAKRIAMNHLADRGSGWALAKSDVDSVLWIFDTLRANGHEVPARLVFLKEIIDGYAAYLGDVDLTEKDRIKIRKAATQAARAA